MFKNVPVTSTRTYHQDYRAVRHSPLPLYTLVITKLGTKTRTRNRSIELERDLDMQTAWNYNQKQTNSIVKLDWIQTSKQLGTRTKTTNTKTDDRTGHNRLKGKGFSNVSMDD